jgi:SAM-dependent methyltransferase
MEHESMVHALGEIHRTLKPNGILIDLRPVEDNWQVEVVSTSSTQRVSSAGWQAAGRLSDLPAAVADDEAASRAMREAESRGWYFKEKEEEFDFFYYWDMPSEMKEFMESEWEDFEKLDEDVYHRTASLWALAGADAGVRVRVRMLIARWEK